MGFLNNMKTIIMLNICSVLPDMYIMIAFMGKALAGARASSQDFFSFSGGVAAVGGGWGVGVLDEVVVRCERRQSKVGGDRGSGRGCTLPLLASV